MYFPYLRGKQFELIALREFARQHPGTEQIIPVIEPVKSTFHGLVLAANEMMANHLHFAIVLNPDKGDFTRGQTDVLSGVPALKDNENAWIPAFLYQNNNGGGISAYINNHGLDNVMIVFRNETDFAADNTPEFLSDSRIKYILNGAPDSRAVKKKLSGLEGKLFIRLDDCFNEKPRNVDYLLEPDEKFTETHRYYKEDGFDGFSDYTTLPKTFADGGMLPYAVAIHMTYEKNGDEIYVRHFVSDTNESQSNIQGKFREAAGKAKNFFLDKPQTTAVKDLIKLLEDGEYPGLGCIKKLSIRNHIELLYNYLTKDQHEI